MSRKRRVPAKTRVVLTAAGRSWVLRRNQGVVKGMAQAAAYQATYHLTNGTDLSGASEAERDRAFEHLTTKLEPHMAAALAFLSNTGRLR